MPQSSCRRPGHAICITFTKTKNRYYVFQFSNRVMFLPPVIWMTTVLSFNLLGTPRSSHLRCCQASVMASINSVPRMSPGQGELLECRRCATKDIAGGAAIYGQHNTRGTGQSDQPSLIPPARVTDDLRSALYNPACNHPLSPCKIRSPHRARCDHNLCTDT